MMTANERLLRLAALTALVLLFGTGGAAMWAQDSTESIAKPTGYVDDWSTHHLVFSNPGTKEDAIRDGRHDEWLKIVNDPRYQMQQLRRKQQVQAPAIEDASATGELQEAAGVDLEGKDSVPDRGPIHAKPGPSHYGGLHAIEKDWTDPLGSGVAASLTTASIGTLGSGSIGIGSTLTIDSVAFHASAPTSSTGTITVGTPYCFAGGDGVTINGVNIATNATKVNGTISFSNPASGSETVVVAGITYTFHLSESGCGTENSTNVCVMHGNVSTDSSDDLEAAINNTPSQCTSTGKSEGNGTTCFFTTPSQANPEVSATVSGSVVTVTPRCAGNYTMTACSGSDCIVSGTSIGSNGTAGPGTFALPATALNTTVASNMATAIGTDTSTDLVTASAASGVITLTGQYPGTTDNVSLALDGSPTGLTFSGAALTGGTNGTTSGTTSPPTFAYWSGNTYVSSAQVATNIATAAAANTTVGAALTVTASSNNLTFTAKAAGTGGNSIAVSAGSFTAFTGAGSLAGGAPSTIQPNAYPAKYGASLTTASCSDYVVYPTGAEGEVSAANIIAFDNLYTGVSGDLCGTAALPTTLWAYNTGTGSAVTTSPVIAPLTGAAVAFIQSTGSAASLVVLKPSIGGTISSPAAAPTTSSTGMSCTAPCMTVTPLSGTVDDTYSSPYYDYVHDAIYVGDNSGKLHKIAPIFNGTTNPVDSTPITLGSNELASPVYDATSGCVFIGDILGYLYSTPSGVAGTVCASTTFGSSVTHSEVLSAGTVNEGIFDAPIVDSAAQRVYAFVTDGAAITGSSGGTCTAGDNCVFEFTTTISGTTAQPTYAESIGTGGQYYNLYSGSFDNVYFSSSATGNLYVIGNTGATTGAALYQIPITSSAMGTPTARVSSLTLSGAHPWPSPLTEFCNGACGVSGSATTTGTDYAFFSLNQGVHSGTCTTTAGNGCIFSYSIDSPTSVTYQGSQNYPNTGTSGCWATGGIVIDNDAASSGASQLYFVSLDGAGAGNANGASLSSSNCSNTAVDAPTINAIQASQSAP